MENVCECVNHVCTMAEHECAWSIVGPWALGIAVFLIVVIVIKAFCDWI